MIARTSLRGLTALASLLGVSVLAIACASPNADKHGVLADASADEDRFADSQGDVQFGLDATVIAESESGPSADESDTSMDVSVAADVAVRDVFAQPFAATSIWNMPIGTGAVYVAAGIAPATGTALEPDDDVIVLTPSAPETQVIENNADWDNTISRCPFDAGALLFQAPLPSGFVVPDPLPDTPNSGLAVLLADGRTIKQTQPFARCAANAPATSHYLFEDVDIYGDGVTGAHGGSGLSAIGGTLRLGELRPGGGAPRHVLKMELDASENYYNDGVAGDCYRWPAVGCDGYFNDASSSLRYGGNHPSLRPGSLLALPSGITVDSLALATEPAQRIAWTLQNYGAYLVDDTAWSAYAMCVENGAAGSFESQFETDWGFSFATNGTGSPFAHDIETLVGALAVVDNNTASNVGGGGAPLQPLAPPVASPPQDQ
jgi:hypothetical protein